MPTDFSAQRLLDDKISRHEAVVITLRTQRNCFSMACKLPVELISSIMLTTRDCLQGQNLRSWLSVAWVCNHWRNVALSTPELWSHISSSARSSLINAMVTRSRNLPLRIHWKRQDKPFKADLKNGVFGGLSERVEDLVVLGTKRPHDSTKFISSTFPRLRKLHVQSYGTDENDVLRPKLDITSLAHTSHLDTLVLDGVTPWNFKFPFMPTVRHLTISDIKISTSDVLSMLSNCPNARSIFVGDIEAGPAIKTAPIRLPYLQGLSVSLTEYWGLESIEVFQHIEHPPLSCFRFINRSNRWADHEGSPVLGLEHLCSRVTFGVQHPSLCRVARGSHAFSLKLYQNSQDTAPTFQLDIPSKWTDLECMSSYLRIMSSLPLEHIQTLVYKCPSYLWGPLENCGPIFSPLRGVENITLRHNVDILGCFLESDLPLHPIRVLTLSGINLREKRSSSMARRKGQIIQFLRVQHTNGHPVRELVLKKCRISESFIEEMRKFANVSVDDGVEFS